MRKLSNDFLMSKLLIALNELAKFSYDFVISLPRSEPIFMQEVDANEFWWQVEMVYLEAWSDDSGEYLMFAVDIRDGYVRLGSTITYAKSNSPEIHIDTEFTTYYRQT